jgi:plasmid maintenance system killer protein
MNIYFADEDLRLDCNNFDRAKKRWDKQKAKKLIRHLGQVRAATSFADLWEMKHLRLEKLAKRKGKRLGQWSIVVEGPLRVIFYPAGDELTWRDPSGDYVWKNMRAIEIIGVVDYHDE